MDLVIEIFRTVQIFQYITIATFTLVCYEYLTKLDDEIHYLWGRRIKFGGVLMALCRYLPFVNVFEVIVDVGWTDMDSKRCLIGYQINSSLVYIEFILSTGGFLLLQSNIQKLLSSFILRRPVVLFTRAYAVWGGDRRVLSLLVFVSVCCIAGSSYATFLFLTNTEAPPFHLPTACLFVLGNNDVWMSLVILIFCESLALGLLLVKSVQHARDTQCLVEVGARTRSILTVMAQDGIGYFACTIVITSASLVILERITPDLRDFLFITQGALQNILCCRLLFHIRSVNEFPDGSFVENSAMQFNAHLPTLTTE
ncbi:hypothetical protein SCHPADRAFT_946179 [Schizopora paradoxa]|uniref:DUF6533 domain-containing protein n=1 Tax=Schizopora paradoxa TaxID=27342 RepID=A0A0H2R3G6_9AGAM|nr:hypothetical protein SCHPADRAFT_946179 [Schizopora paradoxa]